MQIEQGTTSSPPTRAVLLQRAAVKRYYTRNRAKILAKKKLKAKHIAAKEHERETSFQDNRQENQQGNRQNGETGWQETRAYESAPLPDPRLDEPARLRVAKAVKPSFLSSIQAKAVSLFKRVADHASGAMHDERAPDC